MPGTNGDLVKAIEVMPGVARTSGQGDPLLRGAAWNVDVAWLTGEFLAKKAGRLQTGYVYHYAFVMLIGIVALVTWYIFAFAK